MSRILPPENLKIDLTQIETSVCELLDGCANFLHEEKGISITCRIAGGWVRDKVNLKQIVATPRSTISSTVIRV